MTFSLDRSWVLIAAAGSGRRMSSSTPKQFLPLAGKPVLHHVLERVLGWSPQLQVALVWNSLELPSAIESEIPQLGDPRVHNVEGGDSRAGSVLNGLAMIKSRSPLDTPVLVHDAARPLVRFEDVERLVKQTKEARLAGIASGGILATPVTDTVKLVDSRATRSAEPGSTKKSATRKLADNTIAGSVVICRTTLERELLWQAQTPQLFLLGELMEALQNGLSVEGGESGVVPDNANLQASVPHALVISDEASAMERAGHTVLMVEGSRDNIKITRSEDLAVASALLQQH